MSSVLPIRHIRLDLAYQGQLFSGWQRQPHKRTVQQTIEDILSRLTQEEIKLIGASRTDAGVHALHQVAAFKTRTSITTPKLFRALERLFPEDITLLNLEEVDPLFHPIFQAKRKTYAYYIYTEPQWNPFLKQAAWLMRDSLSVMAMRKAAKHLVGIHDFTSFRAAGSDTKTSTRHLESIVIQKLPWEAPYFLEKDKKLIVLKFTGSGFLKQMVRNLVGTLVSVGLGERPPEEVKRILQAKDRRQADRTAPPQGLYLVSIEY